MKTTPASLKTIVTLAACALSLLSAAAQGDSARPVLDSLIASAEGCYRAERFEESLKSYRQAFSLSEYPTHHLYNAACAAARSGRSEEAIGLLFRRLALDPAWYSEHIGQDSDLTALHAHTRWPELLDSLDRRTALYESRFDAPLRRELKEIMERDQAVRQAYVAARQAGAADSVLQALIVRMQAADSLNRKKIAGMLDRYGWLGAERVGDAATVQFYVLQHAPLEMQIAYRPLVEAAVAAGEIQPFQYALFEDRIAVGSGKKQRYGTQIVYDQAGTPRVAPCVDPRAVDSLRRGVGLPPMTQYLARWGLDWEQ